MAKLCLKDTKRPKAYLKLNRLSEGLELVVADGGSSAFPEIGFVFDGVEEDRLKYKLMQATSLPYRDRVLTDRNGRSLTLRGAPGGVLLVAAGNSSSGWCCRLDQDQIRQFSCYIGAAF